MSNFFSTRSIDPSKILRCKLCWKITISVFFAIMVVEAAILFFSVDNYKRDRLAELEREALVVMRTIVRVAEDQGDVESNIQAVGVRLRKNSVLIGARIFDRSGDEVGSFGEKPLRLHTGIEKWDETFRSMTSDEAFLDVHWNASRTKSDYFVSARVDAGEIDAQIVAFIWRITGLVLLISIFVTIVTMLTLEKILLSPVRNFRDQLIKASEDPNNPVDHMMKVRTKDEWGDVVKALNHMLGQSGINLQMIKNQEYELIEHRDRLEKLVDQRTEKLETARRKAETASKAKSAFLANMSHELRTPLNAMIGFSDLQKQEAHGPLGHDSYVEYAEEINTSSKNLLSLINTILDVTKFESFDFKLTEKPFDLGLALDACIKYFEKNVDMRNVSFEFQPSAHPCILNGDEKRIKQALDSLLSNAVKFSKPGSKVKIHLCKDNQQVICVDVIDQGIGMDKKDLQNVLERFGQAEHSYSRGHDGVGLGLTLAKSIIELHDGSIRLKSELGKGTKATLLLPISRMTEAVH